MLPTRVQSFCPLIRLRVSTHLISFSRSNKREFASVATTIIPYPDPPPPPPNLSLLDGHILSTLDISRHTPLANIIKQYTTHTGHILEVSLPYEPNPPDFRRITASDSDSGIVLIAHCVRDGTESKITMSSGFALEAPSPSKGETLILTCAHTLEEIRRSVLLAPDGPAFTGLPGTATGSFCITFGGTKPGDMGMSLHPITGVASALPRSDLLLLSCNIDKSKHKIKTLPVSPYPTPVGNSIRAHFVDSKKQEGWNPWIGGIWNKWVDGKVMGYKDFAGRNAEPGTYDSLSHMLFSPPPSSGSSGGPIIGEETGSVVGVVLGSRMDNQSEGIRGWGVPSETIFEMFTLPGLEGKN